MYIPISLRLTAALACLLAIAAPGAHGQTYPNRPLRIIDANPAGGASDFFARVIAPKLTAGVGQPVVVENRTGAGGTIGANSVAKSPPDGYTLLIGVSGALAASPSLYSKLPYDVIKDFAPVARVASGGYVLVAHPSLPVKSIKELVALAKAKSGQLNYASGGTGSGSHLCSEQIKSRVAINLVHIAYKGGPFMATAVVAGEVELACMTPAPALPLINAGRLRVLAVTSPQRMPVLPDVPTIAESGYPGFEVTDTYGLLAPAATPKDIIALLNTEVRKVLDMADVRERFATQGFVASGSTPEELGEILAAEIAKWAKVIKAAGIRIE